MSDQEQSSQLSALFDGELPPQQADMVIRRALKDAALRASWERYALIGACLRNEPFRADVTRLSVADRVRASLGAEADHAVESLPAPAVAQVAETTARRSLFGRGALGGAIAAGVAVLSIFVVREMAPAVEDTGALVAQQAAQQGAVTQPVAGIDAGLPSYTTPIDGSPAGVRTDARLVNYLVAHSDVAQSAFRFGPLSAAMLSGYDPTQGAVEMTEAEARALR